MGKFISVCVATLQYALGIYVFKKPDLSVCGPLLSSLVVLLALSLVLWSLPLYPRRLRKLIWVFDSLAQYLIAVFLIEYVMGCFWFPLETAVLTLLPKLGSALEETLMMLDLGCHIPCDMLKWEGTGLFISYMLCIFILIAAMHATRVINLKLLAWGITPFVNDVARRLHKVVKNCPVNIKMPSFRPKRAGRREDYCAPDEDDLFEFDRSGAPDVSPSTDTESHYAYRR